MSKHSHNEIPVPNSDVQLAACWLPNERRRSRSFLATKHENKVTIASSSMVRTEVGERKINWHIPVVFLHGNFLVW